MTFAGAVSTNAVVEISRLSVRHSARIEASVQPVHGLDELTGGAGGAAPVRGVAIAEGRFYIGQRREGGIDQGIVDRRFRREFLERILNQFEPIEVPSITVIRGVFKGALNPVCQENGGGPIAIVVEGLVAAEQ